MRQETSRWGVELNGADEDKKTWRALLKQPFDPFVEEIEDERGNYLALRSSSFHGLATAQEVHDAAKQLFKTLNVVMSANADAEPITNGAVVDFRSSGPPKRHHFVEAQGFEMRVRFGIAEVTIMDAQGKVVETPPAPSRAQLWMRAAALEPNVGSGLRYLEGKPGWVELYKAYEALRGLPNGGISSKEIKRFTRTANTGERHHPSEKNTPHRRPMDLWEARTLMTRWLSAAIEDVLARSSIPSTIE